MKLAIIATLLIALAACGGRTDLLEPPTGTTSDAITSEPGPLYTLAAGQYTAYSGRTTLSGMESPNTNAAYAVGSEKSGDLANSVDSASGSLVNPVQNWGLTVFCNTATNCITKIAAGTCHVLFLMQTGQIFGAGCNGQGQLGIPGDFSDKTEPTPLPTGNVVDIAAAGNTSYCTTNPAAFGQPGTAAAYSTGQNDHGQLGINSFTNVNQWTLMQWSGGPGFPLQEMSASGTHFLALDSHQQVFCTGSNSKSQCSGVGNGGGGFPPGDYAKGMLLFGSCVGRLSTAHVAAGAETSYWSGSFGSGGQCTGPVGVNAWGGNSFGQMGIGTIDTNPHAITTTFNPANVSGNAILALAAGPHSAYLMYAQNFLGMPGGCPAGCPAGDKKAHMFVVGNDSSGQLGLGNQTTQSAWTQLSSNFGPSNHSYEIVAGFDAAYEADFSAAVPQTVLVTGGNSDGQLALGGFAPSSLWTPSEL